MNLRVATAVLAVLALAGCTTPPDVRRPTARIVPIKIASLPAGSCVFMNGEYMGLTPLVIPVEADSDGKWKHRVLIQCQVPQDQNVEDTYNSYEGYAVPKHLLFRVPGYTTWYTATQRYAPRIR